MITLPRLRRHRQGEHPYPDETPLSAMERLAPNGQPTFPGGPPPFLAAPAATADRPRPTFTARPPAATRPLEALAVPAQETFSAADRGDRDLLTRVRDGLLGIDTSGRAPGFASDFRSLPLFRQVARSLGWCGLHGDQKAFGWTEYTTWRWHEQAMDAIRAQWWQARSDADEQAGRTQAEIRMELDGYQRAAARRVTVSG